ncbi:MAG: cytochrome c [Hyphomicrobiales bacterium]|nr:cytochrome c [Hyphomicrobiales bacterium]
MIAIILTIIALAAAIGTSLASSPGLTPERQRELAEFVRQDCGSCHGMTLKGGLGRPLSAESFDGRGPEIIAEIILDGIPGTAMPPWRGLLTEVEIDWIAEALKRGEIQ